MSDLLITSGGTFDLDTSEGQYQYLIHRLVLYGAPGKVLSCAEKLYSKIVENNSEQVPPPNPNVGNTRSDTPPRPPRRNVA